MSAFGLEDDEAPVEALAIVGPKPLRKTGVDAIREVEDRLLMKAMGQVENALSWDEIDFGTLEPPAEWVAELGEVEAKRRLRAAQAAQMSSGESPVGLKHAKDLLLGVVKARAAEKAGPRSLNVVVGHIDFVLPDFPRLRVDK